LTNASGTTASRAPGPPTDPFERADVTSNTYWDWFLLATFEAFPPRQKAASFTIDQAVAKLEAALTAGD
jgi:arylsulfatase